MNTPDAQINLHDDFTKKLTVHKSLDQEVIVTTVDKIRLCLMTHKNRLTAKREWTLPASLLVTLSATLAAATFQNFIVDAAVWKAIFILAAMASSVWLVISAHQAWKCRKGGDIEEIVRDLKAKSAADTSLVEPNE